MDYQLEIHHIDVGGGDATLILVRKASEEDQPIVYSAVVDLGGVGAGPKKLNAYIDAYTGDPAFKKNLDLFIASHYHDDHIRGVIYNETQAKATARKKALPALRFKNIIDIGAGPDARYPKSRTVTDSGKQTNLQKAYNTFRAYQLSNGCTEITLPFLSPDRTGAETYTLPEYKLKDGQTETGFSIVFLCGKGVLFNGEDALQPQINRTKRMIDANDLSIGFMIVGPEEMGSRFSYFSAGDLSGDLQLKSYFNLEAPLLKLMKAQKLLDQPVTVVKAMHHGSNFNNHDDYTDGEEKVTGFLNSLKPEVLIVPCNQAKKVPAPEFLKDSLFTYLEENENSRAYFLNKLVYTRKNKNMYNALDKLYQLRLPAGGAFAEKPTNLIFTEKKTATIPPTTSVIVIYPFTEDSVVPDALGNMEQVKKDNYSVFFSNADIGFGLSSYGPTRGSNSLERIIPAYLVPAVKLGINQELDYLATLISKVAPGELAEFRLIENYLSEMVPYLVEGLELEKIWTQKIRVDLLVHFRNKYEEALQTAFDTASEKKEGWLPYPKKQLEDTVEITLITLLYRCEPQIPFLKTFLYVGQFKDLARLIYENLPLSEQSDAKFEQLYAVTKKTKYIPREKRKQREVKSAAKRTISYIENDDDEEDQPVAKKQRRKYKNRKK